MKSSSLPKAIKRVISKLVSSTDLLAISSSDLYNSIRSIELRPKNSIQNSDLKTNPIEKYFFGNFSHNGTFLLCKGGLN